MWALALLAADAITGVVLTLLLGVRREPCRGPAGVIVALRLGAACCCPVFPAPSQAFGACRSPG